MASPSRARLGAAARRILGIAWLCSLGLIPLTAQAAPEPGLASFEAGVGAYRSGQYEAALQQFLEAQRAGLRETNLEFNLGLAYYQLGRYPDARASFERVRGDLRYTHLADYHLGLVAAQEGDRRRALQYLDNARYMADDDPLRQLAAFAVRRLAVTELPRVDDGRGRPEADLYLLLGAGYDSNPALVNDSLEEGGESEEAPYVEFAATGELEMLRSSLGATSLTADLGLRDYSGNDEFDHHSIDLGLEQDWRGRSWRVVGSAEAGLSWLAGDSFQRTTGGGLELRRGRAESNLRLRYRIHRIDGGDDYAYLDGWRHRAGIDLAYPIRAFRLKAYYDFEINERADRERGEEFFSHSPTRHALGLSLSRPFLRTLTLDWRTRYRLSRHADANRFVENGGLRTERRDENLWLAGLRARFAQGKRFSWLLDYQFTRNDSNLERYDYRRHLVLLGLEWLR